MPYFLLVLLVAVLAIIWAVRLTPPRVSSVQVEDKLGESAGDQ